MVASWRLTPAAMSASLISAGSGRQPALNSASVWRSGIISALVARRNFSYFTGSRLASAYPHSISKWVITEIENLSLGSLLSSFATRVRFGSLSTDVSKTTNKLWPQLGACSASPFVRASPAFMMYGLSSLSSSARPSKAFMTSLVWATSLCLVIVILSFSIS